MTLSGGGIVPGPDIEHANASGVLPAAANGGSAGKIGRLRAIAWRSMRWMRSLAFASRYVIAGRFHFRSTSASIEVWSNTLWLTWFRFENGDTTRPGTRKP